MVKLIYPDNSTYDTDGCLSNIEIILQQMLLDFAQNTSQSDKDNN